MTIDLWLAALTALGVAELLHRGDTALGLLAYLVAVLIRPERF